jgi:hypothetical protein
MGDTPAAPAQPATGDPTPPATPEPQQDPLPNTDPQPPAEPQPTPPPEPQGDPDKLGDAGKRALDAERKALRDAKARIKELEPLAAKAREFEDANKSELQRLEDQLAAEREARSNFEQQLLRRDVASDKGLTAQQARFLVGSTREELEDAADELVAAFKATAPPAVPPADPAPVPPVNGHADPAATGNGRPSRPVETLRPGAAPTAEPDEDPAEIAKQIVGGF